MAIAPSAEALALSLSCGIFSRRSPVGLFQSGGGFCCFSSARGGQETLRCACRDRLCAAPALVRRGRLALRRLESERSKQRRQELRIMAPSPNRRLVDRLANLPVARGQHGTVGLVNQGSARPIRGRKNRASAASAPPDRR